MTDLTVIDVSHWQRPAQLDWEQARKVGVVGVIAKATQGANGEDPAFEEHINGAFYSSIAMQGGYHFGDGSDGAKQAKHFLDRMYRAYLDDLTGVGLFLDAERNTSSQMEVAGAEDFLSAIYEAEKRWGWIYIGKDGPNGDGSGLPSSILSNAALWLPKYGPRPTTSKLPPGFSLPKDATTVAGTLRLWQHTDGRINGGAFPGLGSVDQSLFMGVSTVEEAFAIWKS